MMRPLVLVLSLMLVGCPTTVLRQRDDYVAEMAFTNRLVRESAPAVRGFLRDHCACLNNSWRATDEMATDAVCRNQAEWWQVYTTRWSWHHSMMLYNARITDTRPGSIPALPSGVCDVPDVP